MSSENLSHSASARRLAAILFADIQGYTAAMQQDEPRAMSYLDKFKRELDIQVPEHDGEIIQFYGDGCLAIFGSSVDALSCARQLQTHFRQEPTVPVRIGLHVGDVILREDNVFGDAVNIASRIESMGIPGSILLSGSMRRQVKNQPEFELVSLGAYEFKNVEEPVEVFAVANEGFAVPKVSEIQGKLKIDSPKAGAPTWWAALLVSILLIGLIALTIGINRSGDTADDRSPLPEEVREKRVTVLAFENQTMSPSLDAFGKMVSDWLTKGLMETGQANVISADNIQGQIAKAGLSDGANPQLAAATGVDVMIQGRYYLQEDRLIIHATIVEVRSGQVIHALEQEGSKDNMVDMLNELTEEVLGYWAVKNSRRFLQNPPKYEAWTVYLTARNAYTSNIEEAEQYLHRAFELDTSFYAPMFTLIGLYNNTGDFVKQREIFAYLEQRQRTFTQWEKLVFEGARAIIDRDWLQVARAGEKRFRMDPSDGNANYNAAFSYTLVNHPRKALELLQGFDPRYLQEADFAIGWRAAVEAFSHYQLGNYPAILQLVDSYAFPKMFTPLAVFHLKALVRLDSIEQLAVQFEQYRQDGVYGPSGQPDQPDHLLTMLCNELVATDKEILLQQYASRLKQWVTTHKGEPEGGDRPDVFNNAPLRWQEAMGWHHFYLREYPQALAAWTREEVPETNWPDRIERASRLGVCYALLNEEERARTQLELIAEITSPHPDLASTQQYYRARIQAALGQKEEAVASMNRALKLGFVLHRPAVFDRDPFLQSLFGYPPFETLITPKG